jgi:N-acetylglucosamine malate deacetylase 1
MEPLDVLIFAPHPDDAELGMGGTILKLKRAGKRVGVVDLCRGELGTKGTAEIRALEVEASSKILGLDYRANADLGDGRIRDTDENRLLVAEEIRKTRAAYVFVCPESDPHPDHQAGANVVQGGFFLARLPKVETNSPAFSPKRLLHYFLHTMQNITFAIDISAQFPQKLEALRAFQSQFVTPQLPENYTYIGTSDYLKQIEAYNCTIGAKIGVQYAEGYFSNAPIPLQFPTDIQ